jgi:hypothetical protein
MAEDGPKLHTSQPLIAPIAQMLEDECLERGSQAANTLPAPNPQKYTAAHATMLDQVQEIANTTEMYINPSPSGCALSPTRDTPVGYVNQTENNGESVGTTVSQWNQSSIVEGSTQLACLAQRAREDAPSMFHNHFRQLAMVYRREIASLEETQHYDGKRRESIEKTIAERRANMDAIIAAAKQFAEKLTRERRNVIMQNAEDEIDDRIKDLQPLEAELEAVLQIIANEGEIIERLRQEQAMLEATIDSSRRTLELKHQLSGKHCAVMVLP